MPKTEWYFIIAYRLQISIKDFFTVPDNNIERLDHNRLAREMLVLTGSMTLLAWLRFLYCGMRAKLDVEL